MYLYMCVYVCFCWQAEKIATLIKAAGVEVESYWPSLFAKLLEKKSVDDLIMNVGSGGGGGAVSVAAPSAGGAAAPAAAAVEEKKVEIIVVVVYVGLVWRLYDFI